MNIIEKQIIKRYHSDRILQCGGNLAQAQGWKDTASQQSRFEAIISLADFNSAAILDVGCGYGDFKRLLDQRFHDFKYIGIDQQAEFIKRANLDFQHSAYTQFLEADFSTCELPIVDIVVASGVFAYQSSDNNYYFRMIEKLYQASKSQLIFNMLDLEYIRPDSLLTAHSRDKIFAQCKSICENSQLLTNYAHDDFTICMTKTD